MELVLHVLVMICIYATLATSFSLLIGFSGLFAFGHAVFYAIGAYTTAILTIRFHLPFPLPLLCSMIVGAAVGFAVVLPSLRISGIYLIITTLALQVIAIDVLINWPGLTGGPTGLSGVPPIRLFGHALAGPAQFLPLAAVVALLCYGAAAHVGASPFGRALRAMRYALCARMKARQSRWARTSSIWTWLPDTARRPLCVRSISRLRRARS